MDAQTAGKTLFLMHLWGCFWKRLSSQPLDWVKKITLTNVVGHPPICWELKQNKKNKGRVNSLFPVELEHLSSPDLCLWFSGSQDFRLGLKQPPLAFLSLWVTESRLWDFSAPIIQYVLLVLFLENPD
jgi:hypothetical protein